MRSFLKFAIASWLAFVSLAVQSALEPGAASAPEPTVDAVWVVVFGVLFIAVCVWIGIAIFRAEKKNKTDNGSGGSS
jgi:NhaP-type Na+/H+ or K+/H+ antiporter